MGDDIAKLRRVCSSWDLAAVVQIFRRQGITFDVPPEGVVPAIAFGTLDSTLPRDFLCWHVRSGAYTQIRGENISGAPAVVLDRLKTAFERIQDSPEM